MRNVTAIFQGITTPSAELHDRIQSQGWSVSKVAWSSGDKAFVAEAINPHGDKLRATGPTDQTALGNILVKIVRKNHIRATSALRHISVWDTTFTDKMKEIAEAYKAAPVYDPKAAGAWKELAQDSVRRAEIIKTQIKVEIVDNPEPYPNLQEMCKDIHKKHFLVSRANTDHPVWSADESVAFRIVHDVMGHCVSGGDFGWEGENKACSAHFPLLTPTAQQALFTECIAQTSYALYYHGFGPQKVAFLKDHIEEAQNLENPAAHRGLHPSQTIVPSATPDAIPSTPKEDLNKAPLVLAPSTFAKVAGQLDPNHGHDPNLAPTPGFDAYTQHGDPLQAQQTIENASLIDTKWSKMDPTNPSDRAMMKQAIVNAFRVTLLSPRKDLRWNAVHYQDISHIPADVTDPKTYWDALEEKRKAHNVARGRHPEGHLIYFKPRKDYYRLVSSLNPNLSHDEAVAKADKQIFHWRVDEEKKIIADDEQRPPEKQRSADEVERRVNEAIAKILKEVLKEHSEPTADKVDHADKVDPAMSLFGAASPGQKDIFTGEDSGLYGAWMGSHLKAIAQVSQHADEILAAALEDVQQHDGTGHHFRAKVLSLGVSGVGPKVASFTWLILQPMTSQLATIDTHMMDVLGHNYEKDMNHRDYFKFERELQAGRDASGYNHVPLGAFQWGMWDYKRNGPGQHQDHSAMSALNPTPHNQIDWNAKQQPIGGGHAEQFKADWAKNAPEWWQATQDARDGAAQDFDNTLGATVPRNGIPFKEGHEHGEYAKGFDYWWNKHKPMTKHEASKMAEYAAGTKMTKVLAEEFLSNHRDDIDGDYSEFRDDFMKKFNRMNKHGKKPEANPWVPWYHDELSFRTGVPGQSYAHFLHEHLGIQGPEFWKLEHASLGKYNPQTKELRRGAGNADEQAVRDNLSVLHYDPTRYA